MDSLTFLARTPKSLDPLYIVHGDEYFLKRQVLHKLRHLVLGDDADEFSESVHAGDKADYATVMDELATVPFFGDRRLVLIENADPFVSANRALLEKAVAALPDAGVLVLEVKTWTATTRLAKLIDAKVTISCKSLSAAKLASWCVDWAKNHHEKQLTQAAARMLIELVGTEMGQLDQELAKLAVYVGKRNRIGEDDVDTLVGRSQAQNIWLIFDALGQGKAHDALMILGQLLDQGEEPIRILGAFSMQLRRIALTGRLCLQGIPMTTAMQQAGVPPFFARGCQQQLKHLGPARTAQLYDWLMQINLDLRGNSPLTPRTLLERLVIRLARPRQD